MTADTEVNFIRLHSYDMCHLILLLFVIGPVFMVIMETVESCWNHYETEL